MRGWVKEGTVLVPRERPVPEVKPGELLLRPSYNALCYSEKHEIGQWAAAHPGSWDLCRPTVPGMDLGNGRILGDGIIWGHQFSGIVEEVGAGVEGFRVGDRIAVEPSVGKCGKCWQCQAGLGCTGEQSALGYGGYGRTLDSALAPYISVPIGGCYLIPEGVTLIDATLMEPVAQSVRAVRHGTINLGQNVVFFGGDDYSLAAVQLAHAVLGSGELVVVDPYEVRRAAATRMGATRTIDPNNEDVNAAIFEQMPFGADVCFVACEDYVGAAHKYMAQALEVVRIQGEICVLRMYNNEPLAEIEAWRFWTRDITIKSFGVWMGNEPAQGGRTRGDFQLTLDLFASGTVRSDLWEPEIIDLDSLKTSEEMMAIYDGLPERAALVIFKIHGDE
jgi:(R,R)-butanediol dehydrogenase/meso-butanediol dehydrogenase/diacetyl reductase